MTYTPIPRGTQNWDVPLNSALAQLDASITSSAGAALQAANNLSDLTNAPQARINLGLTGLANSLSNMTATSDPAVTSDNTQGYSIGSTWFNTTTNSMFVATNVATSTAVWLQIPPTFVDRTTTQSIAGNKIFTSNTTFSNAGVTTPTVVTTSTTNGGVANRFFVSQTADYAISVRTTGDLNSRALIAGSGNISWGDGTNLSDTTLYRSGVGVLTTDTNFQAANIDTGAWTAYTPTWTAATTNPVIGNGTLSGAYSRIGKTCHFRLLMNSGTTTTYGSGVYTFTLPFTASAASGVASAQGQALAASTRVILNGLFTANSANLSTWGPTSATAPNIVQIGSATGMAGATWTASTANQFIRVSGTYETA